MNQHKCYWCGEEATRSDTRETNGYNSLYLTCNMCYLVATPDLIEFRRKRLEKIGLTDAELIAKLEKPLYTDNLLIETLEEYIKLLEEELNSMGEFAHMHGWLSTRGEIGEELRHQIKLIKEGYTLF